MSHAWAKKLIPVIGILILIFCVQAQRVIAEDQPTESELEVQKTIQEKKNNIEELNLQIEDYKKKIEQKQSEKLSLSNEMDLLQNRIEKTQLQIDETKAKIDLANVEIAETQTKITETQKKLDRQIELITSVVHEIQSQDNTLPIELFYGSDRFSALLDTIQKLEQINADLSQSVKEAKNTQTTLALSKKQEESQRDQLEALEQSLLKEKTRFSDETEAKQVLIDSTQQSENRFQKLLQELKQEQVFVQNQIKELSVRLENKIKTSDQIGGGLLTWPINPNARGISAYFHDPSYPFRNLFEHPGIDLPAPVGTSVRSAAAGYVAWTRRGAQYGNYVMVIHSDGIATLYAHLSRIDVVADQFIPRGGQIGLVGVTGLTTGPHLHFEVRKEGIPTNPMSYLQTQ